MRTIMKTAIVTLILTVVALTGCNQTQCNRRYPQQEVIVALKNQDGNLVSPKGKVVILEKLYPINEVITITTKEEYDGMMRLCEAAGWELESATYPPTTYGASWESVIPEEDCIRIWKEGNGKITISWANQHNQHYFFSREIISFPEFLKRQREHAIREKENERSFGSKVTGPV